jgi:hypothetical protein
LTLYYSEEIQDDFTIQVFDEIAVGIRILFKSEDSMQLVDSIAVEKKAEGIR